MSPYHRAAMTDRACIIASPLSWETDFFLVCQHLFVTKSIRLHFNFQFITLLICCQFDWSPFQFFTISIHHHTPFSLPCRAGAARLISRQWMTSLDLCLPSGQGSQPWRRQPALAGLASPRHCRREPKGH